MHWINLNDLKYERGENILKKHDLIRLKDIDCNLGQVRCIFPVYQVLDGKYVVVKYPKPWDLYNDRLRGYCGYIKKKFLLSNVYKVLDHEKNCFCSHKIYDGWIMITDDCLKLNKLESQNLSAKEIKNKYDIQEGDFILVKSHKYQNGQIYRVNNVQDSYPLIDVEHEHITSNGMIRYTKTKIFINKYIKIQKGKKYHKIMDLSYIINRSDRLIDCENIIGQDITQLFNSDTRTITNNNNTHFKYKVLEHIKNYTFKVGLVSK